ncbi:hypothetical protein AB0C87_22750 [Actinomadura sp. NPDC048021]|uniref:hypothetical protein n=1 Tax=Actinomadura sp. NPDC048021 TaxID=3155385 RepID=UPI0033CB7B84
MAGTPLWLVVASSASVSSVVSLLGLMLQARIKGKQDLALAEFNARKSLELEEKKAEKAREALTLDERKALYAEFRGVVYDCYLKCVKISKAKEAMSNDEYSAAYDDFLNSSAELLARLEALLSRHIVSGSLRTTRRALTIVSTIQLLVDEDDMWLDPDEEPKDAIREELDSYDMAVWDDLNLSDA